MFCQALGSPYRSIVNPFTITNPHDLFHVFARYNGHATVIDCDGVRDLLSHLRLDVLYFQIALLPLFNPLVDFCSMLTFTCWYISGTAESSTL